MTSSDGIGQTLSVGFRPLPERTPWWTEVEPDEVKSGLAWLREEVYGGYLPRGGIPRRRVTAFERWREDPADLAEPAPAHPGVPALVVV